MEGGPHRITETATWWSPRGQAFGEVTAEDQRMTSRGEGEKREGAFARPLWER